MPRKTPERRSSSIPLASSLTDNNNKKNAQQCTWKNPSTVVMIEPITSSHTIDNTPSGSMDIKPLLRLMDIATCASAEKHTHVNCVTVSMGDVVLEYIPQCGDLLELTATPVYTGNTSLDIGLTVICETSGGVRQFVCYASFTYVTVRDEHGKKQLCPPLVKEDVVEQEDAASYSTNNSIPESVQWERTVAFYRRALIKAERKSVTANSDRKSSSSSSSGFHYEFSEVVLPAHLNHMGHTFGGIVMAWMCKAALAEASRRTSGLRVGTLRIRAIERIDFREGSDVSDHLLFRPRLNAIFDQGRSAEIEVRVWKRSIQTGEETRMNTGYFYVSGVEFGTIKKKKEEEKHRLCPFANNSSSSSTTRNNAQFLDERIQADAIWRRRQLLARRNLLGGVGETVEWHPALHDEAPLLTILAVLRLVHDLSVEWKPLHSSSSSTTTYDNKSSSLRRRSSSMNHSITTTKNKPRATNVEIKYTTGEALGRKNTFILRGKSVIQNMTVKALFKLIKDERPQWDEICKRIDPIERQTDISADDNIQWDVVQHVAITPTMAMLSRYLCYCCCNGGMMLPETTVPLCLLRAWRTEESNTILATRSVRHPKAAKGSMTEVLPSGWFLSPNRETPNSQTRLAAGAASNNNNTTTTMDTGVSITYVVEHDLQHLRRLAPTFTDEAIIHMIAKSTKQWFTTFASMGDAAAIAAVANNKQKEKPPAAVKASVVGAPVNKILSPVMVNIGLQERKVQDYFTS